MTMKTYKVIFALLLIANISNAQSVNLDRFPISPTFRQLPKNPLGFDYKTYSVRTELGKFISTMYDKEIIANKINLGGFNYTEENPDLNLHFTCEDIAILKTEIKNRVEENKDKNGNVTSRNTLYWFELEYTLLAKYNLIDNKKGGITLVKADLDTRNNKYVYKSEETSSYKSAKEAYELNKENVVKNIVNAKFDNYIEAINNYLTHNYGYPEITTYDILWIVGSKKHPEYAQYNEVAKKIAEAIKKMNGSEPVDTIKEELKPSIEYLKGLPEKYTSNDKLGRKMRYSAYFNLATIYFYLDELDEVVKYANLIISNDYDTNDGKIFNNKVEELKKLFEKNNINTRHFER